MEIEKFMKSWKEARSQEECGKRRQKFDAVLRDLRIFYEINYKDSTIFKELLELDRQLYTRDDGGSARITRENSNLQIYKENAVTKAIKEAIEREKSKPQTTEGTKLETISTILNNFHSFVKVLENRHDHRTPFTIADEYDVQDLLHALLRVHFKDVRSEEATPSMAGKSGRIDKLLKIEKIAIETKIVRKNLKDKEIGDEIKIDYASYSVHPDCKMLICFIYDPELILRNAHGLKSDLESLDSNGKFPIKVFITPHL